PFNFVGTRGYYADSAGISTKKYVRARYYDTYRCRWFTEDPIGFRGRDYNLYRYVKNNSTSTIDPSGLIGTKQDCDEEKEKCLRQVDRTLGYCDKLVDLLCAGGGLVGAIGCALKCFKIAFWIFPVGSPLLAAICGG